MTKKENTFGWKNRRNNKEIPDICLFVISIIKGAKNIMFPKGSIETLLIFML